MNFIDVLIFLQSYSLPTVLIALAVSVIFFALDKILKNKIPKAIITFIPPLLCALIYFAYDMIFVSHAFRLNAETLSAGVICSSVHLIITAVINAVFKSVTTGKIVKVNFTPEVLAISESVKNYVAKDKENEVAEKIASYLDSQFNGNEITKDERLTAEILEILKAENNGNNSEIELLAVSATALASYKAIKNL